MNTKKEIFCSNSCDESNSTSLGSDIVPKKTLDKNEDFNKFSNCGSNYILAYILY